MWTSDPQANTDAGVRDKYLGIFGLLGIFQVGLDKKVGNIPLLTLGNREKCKTELCLFTTKSSFSSSGCGDHGSVGGDSTRRSEGREELPPVAAREDDEGAHELL